jgi:hypothetical protein
MLGKSPKSRSHEAGIVLLDAALGATLFAAAVMASAQIVLDTNSLLETVEIKRVVVESINDELAEIESTPFEDIFATHNGRAFSVEEEEGYNLMPPQGDKDGLPGEVTLLAAQPLDDPTELIDVTIDVLWADPTGTRQMIRTLRVSRVGGVQ